MVEIKIGFDRNEHKKKDHKVYDDSFSGQSGLMGWFYIGCVTEGVVVLCRRRFRESSSSRG